MMMEVSLAYLSKGWGLCENLHQSPELAGKPVPDIITQQIDAHQVSVSNNIKIGDKTGQSI